MITTGKSAQICVALGIRARQPVLRVRCRTLVSVISLMQAIYGEAFAAFSQAAALPFATMLLAREKAVLPPEVIPRNDESRSQRIAFRHRFCISGAYSAARIHDKIDERVSTCASRAPGVSSLGIKIAVKASSIPELFRREKFRLIRNPAVRLRRCMRVRVVCVRVVADNLSCTHPAAEEFLTANYRRRS